MSTLVILADNDADVDAIVRCASAGRGPSGALWTVIEAPREPQPQEPSTQAYERWFATAADRLAAWLAGCDGGEHHLIAFGDHALTACHLALTEPDVLASLTLVDADVLRRGADAMSDMSELRERTGAAAVLDTLGHRRRFALQMARKAGVHHLVSRWTTQGAYDGCPVCLISRTPASTDFSSLDLFDLFAVGQPRSEMHAVDDRHPEEWAQLFLSFASGMEP